jgi:hypothetical protein
VAHEDEIVEFFGVDQPHHVGDVRVQRDVRAKQVRAFAVTGECDGVHRVAGGAQRAHHALPDPCAAPGAVHE